MTHCFRRVSQGHGMYFHYLKSWGGTLFSFSYVDVTIKSNAILCIVKISVLMICTLLIKQMMM